ncbi:MAG: methyltransferase family protein [Planctomycetota bacterium]|jgi:protein-S-isoprenylcysteine O-methyltransferase Ste14
MIFFRLYLLSGLILHKAVWIAMKRRGRADSAATVKSHSPQVLLARLVKLAILLLISVQVFLADVFPILDEPLALRIAGGVLYSLGLITAVLGRIQLGDSWSDIEVGDIAVDKQVVSGGVYRYLRHPIYVGDLLLLLGLELSLNSWLVVVAAALVPPVVVRAVQEERSLRKMLTGYEDYARRTKRFIPFIV